MTPEEQAAADKAARAAEFKAIVAESLKPVTDSIGALTTAQADIVKNQKVLADTFAAQTATDAAAAKEKKEKEGEAEAPKPLTADEIKKLVADGVTAAQQQQATTAEQKAKRAAFIDSDASGLKKLPPEYKDRLGADPAKWADEAKAIAGSWEKFVKDNKIAIPDVGGAAREGGDAGKTNAATPVAGISGLADGTQKFADGIKLPTEAAAPARAGAAAAAAP